MATERQPRAQGETLRGRLTIGWDSPGSRGHPGRNRILANDDYRQGPMDLPFKPLFWGTCQWGRGDYWERERCTFFGVEQVLAGDARFVQNGREYLLEQGDTFLLQPSASHRYETGPSGRCERLYVGIGGSLIESFLTRTGLDAWDVLRAPPSPELAGRLRRFEAPMGAEAQKDQQALSLLAYEFLLYLATCVCSSYPAPVRDALAFIRQRLDRDLSNAQIARAAGVSVPHLARLFRRALRVSPVCYHARERMARARVLLRYSSQSVKQVAQSLGYSDPLYFSKRFSKHAGMSPRRYRRQGMPDGQPENAAL